MRLKSWQGRCGAARALGARGAEMHCPGMGRGALQNFAGAKFWQ